MYCVCVSVCVCVCVCVCVTLGTPRVRGVDNVRVRGVCKGRQVSLTELPV